LPKPKKRNLFVVVQDRSGSMGSRVEETINGFNSYVERLQKEAKGETRMWLYQFDNEYTPVFEDVHIKDVEPLTRDTYWVRGSTALLDAVGRTLSNIEGSVTEKDKVTVVIMTDGHENSSREFDLAKVRNMMKDREGRGNWTFVYLGAGEDAWDNAGMLGFAAGNTLNYAGDARAHKHAFDTLTASSVAHTRSAAKATASYFEPPRVSESQRKKRDEPVASK
jgi:uncharacterized protein YegL